MKIQAMQVGPIGTNCYILTHEASGRCAVIDPGDEARSIAGVLRQLKVEPEYILLTHGHYDHTTGVPELHELYPDAKIYIHQADANGAGSQLFPLASQVDELLLYGEGDKLTLGDITIEVMHTPGHSLGSVVLKAGNVLFTGDTLFAGSCGRTDLPGGSYKQIMESLKRLGELEGDYIVLPGHDIRTTLEQERKRNYYLSEAMR